MAAALYRLPAIVVAYADRQAALLYYTARDGSPLNIVGLWDAWKDIETGALLHSCTSANALAARVHDRMPVLLQPQHIDRWLAGTPSLELLKPAPDDYLQVWPVSRRVNSSRAPGDDPALIERIAALSAFGDKADMSGVESRFA